jgi:tetratricopeptide (TPR) repeat protein
MKNIICAAAVLFSLYTRAQQKPCIDIQPPQLSEETKKIYEQKLAEAKSKLTIDSNSAEHIIWYGRRTAYLGDYMAAIEIFTKGFEKHPSNPRFLRHRGHRYITVRCLDKAIADLSKAADMLKDQVDEVEQDGLPNARNLPTSTLKTNTYYHLGLAYFLKGDYKNALKAYYECLEFSDTEDMYVATANWRYITLLRLNKKKEAEELLKNITAEMDIIENQDYFDVLMAYKTGDSKKLEERIQAQDNLSNATLGFALGNFYLEKGQKKKAKELFEKVVAGNQWASFGYMAAEVELRK